MRARWLAAAAVGVAAVAAAGFVGYREEVVRPRVLRAAGPVPLGPVGTSTSPDRLLPPAIGTENAARYYVAAASSYATRRIPYLRSRALNPILPEPRISPVELHAMLRGAAQADCDLYAGRPPFVLAPTAPREAPWRFAPAEDPMAPRRYLAPFRLVGQAALNEGKLRERLRKTAEAERIYQAVVRMGFHLLQRPGCLSDLELGVDLSRRGLHYLDKLYLLTGRRDARLRCWELGDAAACLDADIQARYAQLSNPEAAMLVLARSRSPIWRVEAAAALEMRLRTQRPDPLEAYHIRRALHAAAHQPDPQVRAAVSTLARLHDTAFRSPDE